jgi:hypothetical protein
MHESGSATASESFKGCATTDVPDFAMRGVSTPMRAYIQMITRRELGLRFRWPSLDSWLEHRTW